MASIPSEKQELEDEESFSYAVQLSNSIVLSMALQSAIELGVFEVLQKAGRDTPLSSDEIASRLSCTNPDAPKMLDRILALLASHSVLNCSVHPDQHNLGSFHRLYAMTSVAKFFAPNSDGVSLGPLIALHQDKIYLQSWSQLKDAIREGGIPFNRVYGTNDFEYASIDSRFNQVFNTAMINHTTIVMNKVLQSYKGFEDVKRLVDVGGGLGVNINLITSKHPHIHGINFDLPHVIQHAPSYPGVEHVGETIPLSPTDLENMNHSTETSKGSLENKKLETKTSKSKRPRAHGRDHIMAERNRREKLTQSFIALAALVPNLKKMDKLSVLIDTIKYMKELKNRLEDVEEQNKKTKKKSSTKPCLCSDEDSSSCEDNIECVVGSPFQVEARVLGKQVLIRIQCKEHKGLLVKIMVEIQKFQLFVVNNSVLPFGDSTLDITIIAQLGEGYNLSIKELVKNVRMALLKFTSS